jgi:DNA-3-methyladenine glycosylase I
VLGAEAGSEGPRRPDLVVGEDGLARCSWGAGADYRAYHDQEWGRALHGDAALFERLSLEAFQSGLSWLTILRKRPAFRTAFGDFVPDTVAAYGEADVARLLADEGIVRNRAKVAATIANARTLVALRASDGDGALDRLVWSFAPDATAAAPPRRFADVPATTPASTGLARALKRVGFVFVGPTTAYALMQACGLVNDHLLGCHARADRAARTER